METEPRNPRVERAADDAVRFHVGTDVYPEDVVFKALYWYGGDYDIDVLAAPNGPDWNAPAAWRRGDLGRAPERASPRVCARDLVDFRTRAIVARETQTVRELLVAKAFADTDAFDQEPPGSPEDPVGFRIADWEEDVPSTDRPAAP